MKKYLAPSLVIVLFTAFFVVWQFFYSYQLLRFGFVADYIPFLSTLFVEVNWDNYFLKKISLLVLWLIASMIIFSLMLFKEVVGNLIYNSKIKKQYINQEAASYNHLLRKNLTVLKARFVPHALITFSFGLFLIGLFMMADLFEIARNYILNLVIVDLIINNQDVNFDSFIFPLGTFILITPFWYIWSVLISYTYKKGKEEAAEEKIVENHFAIEES